MLVGRHGRSAEVGDRIGELRLDRGAALLAGLAACGRVGRKALLALAAAPVAASAAASAPASAPLGLALALAIRRWPRARAPRRVRAAFVALGRFAGLERLTLLAVVMRDGVLGRGLVGERPPSRGSRPSPRRPRRRRRRRRRPPSPPALARLAAALGVRRLAELVGLVLGVLGFGLGRPFGRLGFRLDLFLLGDERLLVLRLDHRRRRRLRGRDRARLLDAVHLLAALDQERRLPAHGGVGVDRDGDAGSAPRGRADARACG